MKDLRLLKTNFSGGELDPQMFGRINEKIYANGAARLQNVLTLNTGGAQSRPGTKRLTALPSKMRIVSFEFSADEKYIIAFGDRSLFIYDPVGTLLQSFGAVDCPWTSGQVPQLTYAQIADTMFIAHMSFAPIKLLRTSLTTFDLNVFEFDESTNNRQSFQPFAKFSTNNATLSPSGNTGSITLTCSENLFVSDHVGTRFTLRGNQLEITGINSAVEATADVKSEKLIGNYSLNPFRTTKGSGVVEITEANHGLSTGASITIDGSNAVGGITAVQLDSTFSITVIDEDHYEVTTAGTATESEDGGGPSVTYDPTNVPTRLFQEQSFSNVRGWPGAVSLHQNRLWFGGSSSQPAGLWSSRVGTYANFDLADGEDDASIQIEVGVSNVSNIRHIVSNRDMQVFSETAEFFLPQGNAGLTPSSISVQRQTSFGSSFVTPIPFDGATIFAQQNSRTIREFLFSDGEAAYRSVNLNIAASHVVNDVQDVAALQGNQIATEQYALIVNGDGTLAVFVSARDEKFAAWVQWETKNGTFDSVCVLDTIAYVSVLRNGVYYLEQFSQDSYENMLDSQSSFISAGGKSVWQLGLGYANQTLDVSGDGYYYGQFTADSSGQIDLGVSYTPTQIEVGFAYPFEIKTLPIDAAFSFGSLVGAPRRLSRITLILNKTIGISVDGQRISLYRSSDDISQPPAQVTGIRQVYLRGWDRNPQITITQTQPFPVTLLGMNMEFTV